jgi:hypothetical protein
MTETQSYAIEVIKLVPNNSLCFIQAPSIELTSALHHLLTPSPYDYYKQIVLTPINKTNLVDIIKKEEVEGYFQSIEIWYGKKLFFQGWDGMEYGHISRDINLPDAFVTNYISTEMCYVSKEW